MRKITATEMECIKCGREMKSVFSLYWRCKCGHVVFEEEKR